MSRQGGTAQPTDCWEVEAHCTPASEIQAQRLGSRGRGWEEELPEQKPEPGWMQAPGARAEAGGSSDLDGGEGGF